MNMNNSNILFLSTLIAFFCFQSSIYENILPIANAKEIEATSEWQLLKEGDTIPAGLHVRMDMSTGEKWVKLNDDNDDDDNNNNNNNKNSAQKIHSKAVSITENPTEKENEPHPNNDKVSSSSSSSAHDERPKYNFEMMHRALSKLPDDEKFRMGGIPELPQTPDDVIAFETRMTDIWIKRQKEIEEAQELLADLPELLRDRIDSIKSYLDDDDSAAAAANTSGSSDSIIETLTDLEYQLSDLDNARDFHTLGGWPLLVSLLSPSTHPPNNNNNNNTLMIIPIQTKAAWVIGTAVKNHEEFFPWAVEAIPLLLPSSSSTKTTMETPLSLLLSTFETDDLALRQKSLYAMGALLRGNFGVHAHFLRLDGVRRLARGLEKATINREWKFVAKILSLGKDLVEDILLEEEGAYKELLNELTAGREWCRGALELINDDTAGTTVTLREKGLDVLRVLGGYCKDGKDIVENAKSALMLVGEQRRDDCQSRDDDNCREDGDDEEDIDEEYKKDLIDLFDEVLAVMA